MGAVQQALLMGGIRTDPLRSLVKLHLSFDNNLTDSSASGPTYAFNAGAAYATTGQLAGSASLDCTSSTNDHVAGAGTPINPGTQDFCFEFFWKDPTGSPGNQFLMLLQGVAIGDTFRFYRNTTGFISTDIAGASPPVDVVTYTDDVWHHSAITRNGSNWTHWFNGVARQTWVNSTFNTGGGSSNIWIGSGSSGGTGLRCFIDEVRFTIGSPRYTADFTPSFPFPTI